jgi:hypothetical protein
LKVKTCACRFSVHSQEISNNKSSAPLLFSCTMCDRLKGPGAEKNS